MPDDLVDRLRQAVAQLEELRARPSISFLEAARLTGKIQGVKLAASYLEESNTTSETPYYE